MENVLVAVSGGSDSLALLDMLYKNNEYNLIVAHVNYNYRETSKIDERIVKDYCEKRKIKYYVLSIDSNTQKEGNFEDWARVTRYKFFKDIYIKENCIALYVGHQKDDLIETYLLQKNRKSIVEFYGLVKENIIQGMKVIRPLLGYSKSELEKYCKDNKIEYGVDETNFDVTYSRNKIRHEVISKLSKEEIDEIISEINELNKEKIKHNEYINNIYNDCLIKENLIDLDKFNKYSLEEKVEIIYHFLIKNVYKKISIKRNRLLDIVKKIESNKPNIILARYEKMILYKEYKNLLIEENNDEYCYEIDNLDKKEIGNGFIISNNGKKLERVVARVMDFPLYLKNYDGTNNSINRLFINKKIPLRKRKSWPVIVDKFDRLLLVINIKKLYNESWNNEDEFVEFYIKNKDEKGE